MKLRLLFIGSICFFLGCINHARYTEFEEILSVNEPLVFTSLLGDTHSLPESGTFPVGSDILVNATGALKITNQKYSWRENFWEGDETFSWEKEADNATLLALYPYFSNFSYLSSELYDDGNLVDILYDYKQLKYKEKIELAFKHRFALVSISSSDEVQKLLRSVKLTVPCTVSSLSTTTGEIICDFSTDQTVVLPSQPDGNYQFIIPPVDDLELEISLDWGGELYTHRLENRSFQSNHRYNYFLKSAKECVGIKSVSDFIAFAKLINGESYTGDRSLADFGTTENGLTTYYLLDNLCFSPEDSLEISLIGTKTPFEDIFEGNNYTLSGLRLNRLKSCYGLFYSVGTRGVVRNLHVKDSQIYGKSSAYATSFIVAYNAGVVDHCSVVNSTISLPTSTGGSVVAISSGVVLNCWSWNCYLDLGIDSWVGGVVGGSSGNIYNCYAGNHTFKVRSSASYAGICHQLMEDRGSKITNCYYQKGANIQKLGGILYTSLSSSRATISHCYTNHTNAAYSNPANALFRDNFGFNENFIYNSVNGPRSVLDVLNDWVLAAEESLPDYTFKKWVVGTDGVPASFMQTTLPTFSGR
ncbi:MAG: fimbrillin family protein [Phocaeicola sp.]